MIESRLESDLLSFGALGFSRMLGNVEAITNGQLPCIPYYSIHRSSFVVFPS